MSRLLRDVSNESAGGGDIGLIHVDEFADCNMSLENKKAALEQYRWNENEHFGIESFEEQERVLNLADLVWSAVNAPDPSATDNNIGTVLDANDD